MKYIEGSLKNYFEEQKNYLNKLVEDKVDIEKTIITLEQKILKETDSNIVEQLNNHLNEAKTNLTINKLHIHSITTLMYELNQLALSSNLDSLYTVEDEKIVGALSTGTDDSLEVSTKIIKQKFEELKSIYEIISKETALRKKEELLKTFDEKKNELSSLKSKLSCKMRKLNKTGKINNEDFEKFKKEQFEYNKEHYELYQKVKEINVKADIKENKLEERTEEIKNEETTEEIKNEEVTPIYGSIPNRMKNSKTANTLIDRIQNAVSTREKLIKVSTEGNQKEVKQALKEDKKAQRKINISRNQELLKQRDTLAKELSEIFRTYGTANNIEYQTRLEQLKELDKKIFGRKAKRIYRDFKKPVNMVGGTYIELPKAYINIRLEDLGQTR